MRCDMKFSTKKSICSSSQSRIMNLNSKRRSFYFYILILFIILISCSTSSSAASNTDSTTPASNSTTPTPFLSPNITLTTTEIVNSNNETLHTLAQNQYNLGPGGSPFANSPLPPQLIAALQRRQQLLSQQSK